MKVLNRHAPLKKKILRAKHSSYISKMLRKAIMRKLILRKSIKKTPDQSLRAYEKQKNYCSILENVKAALF